MHLEPFEVMSYVTVTDHCGSHAFGHTLQDFQLICESTAWDLPEGLVVFNASIGKSLVFQSGVVASTIALWSAIHYLRARQSIGLIMHREGEWLTFSLVEVHRYLGHRKFHGTHVGADGAVPWGGMEMVKFLSGQTRQLPRAKHILTECLAGFAAF